MRAVVQGRDAEAGAQGLPADEDGQVGSFPGARAAVWAARASPTSEEDVGVASDGVAAVGHGGDGGVGVRRVGRSVIGTRRGARVRGIPPGRVGRRGGPTTATPRWLGWSWLVGGFGAGTVGVEVGQDVLADPVQRSGVKRPGHDEPSSASAASRSSVRTLAGIAPIVSVITRTCAGPISPAASAAAVAGSNAGRFSPVSARRGASWWRG